MSTRPCIERPDPLHPRAVAAVERFPCQALEGRVSDILGRAIGSWLLNSNAAEYREFKHRTGNGSCKKVKAPEPQLWGLRAEGVHPPCDLLGADTGTATASVNPSVWAAEQAGSFSEQAPDHPRPGAYSLSRSCRLDVQRPPGGGRCAPGLMKPRQPRLSCALFLCRQALTRSTFGISALHKRNASPVHACRPSGV